MNIYAEPFFLYKYLISENPVLNSNSACCIVTIWLRQTPGWGAAGRWGMVSIYGIPPQRNNNCGCTLSTRHRHMCTRTQSFILWDWSYTTSAQAFSWSPWGEFCCQHLFIAPSSPVPGPALGSHWHTYGASSLPLYQYRGYVSIFHFYLHTGPIM